MARQATWYFDFISPYAYLQFKHFERLPGDLEITCCPVLFAGLLGHWEHKGPAEIPAKRVQTYQYTHWLAERLGIPFKTPPAHPFNPLKVLRLAIACDSRPDIIGGIFDYLWGSGGDVDSEEGFAQLTNQLGIKDVQSLLSQPEVKAQLRQNTEDAITRGVYGVPTFAVEDSLFWGFDTTDMLIDYLNKPGCLDSDEMRRLAALPAAAERPR